MIQTIRRIVGWTLVIIALWMFSPPGLPPDDFINVIIGDAIAKSFNISLISGIIITYTVIPFAVLYLACIILPGNTHVLFHQFLAKVKSIFMAVFSDPRRILIAIGIIVIMYIVYITYIADYLTSKLGLGMIV